MPRGARPSRCVSHAGTWRQVSNVTRLCGGEGRARNRGEARQSMTCLSLVPLTGRFYSGKIGLEEEVRVVTDDHNDHTATRAVAVYNTKKVKVCSVSMSSLSPPPPPLFFCVCRTRARMRATTQWGPCFVWNTCMLALWSCVGWVHHGAIKSCSSLPVGPACSGSLGSRLGVAKPCWSPQGRATPSKFTRESP